MIDQRDQAIRFARAVITDVRQHEAETIAKGGVPSESLEEGRALFRSRVVPQLHDVYEAELEGLALPGASTAPPRDDQRERATSLARALLADIREYNAETIAHGGDPSEFLEEGRALFRSRFGPELHHVYETELEQSGLLTRPKVASPQVQAEGAPLALPSPPAVSGVADPLPSNLFDDPKPSNTSTSSGAAWGLGLLVVLGVVLAWFLLQ